MNSTTKVLFFCPSLSDNKKAELTHLAIKLNPTIKILRVYLGDYKGHPFSIIDTSILLFEDTTQYPGVTLQIFGTKDMATNYFENVRSN
jgi:hypothetical protein